jgi:hypothetical protein
MKASLSVSDNSGMIKIETMLDRGKSMQSFLNRNVYRIYQNAQRSRWITENASEGGETGRWEKLNPTYAERKKKIYAAYEGAGEKMLIATGRLFKAVVGPSNGQIKVVTNTSMTISTSVEYAKYVNEARSFSTWGPSFKAKVKKAIGDFILYNIGGAE